MWLAAGAFEEEYIHFISNVHREARGSYKVVNLLLLLLNSFLRENLDDFPSLIAEMEDECSGLTNSFFANLNRDREGQEEPRPLKQTRKIPLPSVNLNYESLHSPLHPICDGKLQGIDCRLQSSPVCVIVNG